MLIRCGVLGTSGFFGKALAGSVPVPTSPPATRRHSSRHMGR
jgi:hypothetical protein